MSFLHGIEILEIDEGIQPIRGAGTSTIGLAGFVATGMDAKAKAGLYLITNEKEAVIFGKNNFISDALRAIFLQSSARVVVSLVDVVKDDKGKTNAEQSRLALIGSVENGFSGIKALEAAGSTFGVKPKILLAENSHEKPIGEALLVTAEKQRGFAIIDAPDSETDAIAYAKNLVDMRAFIVYPKVVSAGREQALSPFVAGLTVKIDNEYGFFNSPSNKKIRGIDALKTPIDFVLGDQNCKANILNQNHIATLINEKGLRLWGNHTTSDVEKWRFLSVRRIADMLNDSILNGHLWAVDRNINKGYVEEVQESVNAFIRELISKGALLGGRCLANSDLNSKTNVLKGQIVFDIEFTTPYPAERVTFRSILTDKYIKEIS